MADTVTIREIKAENLVRRDRDGSDPYVQASVGRTTYKTRYEKNVNDPVWQEEFTFNLSSPWLKMTVYDYDGPHNAPDPLGSGSVHIGEMEAGEHEVTLDLMGQGTLTMQLVIDTGDEPEEEVPEAEAEVDCNPTEDELGDLNAACGRLWDLDTNRLVFDEDFAINLQSGVGSWSDNDAAADPLFTFVKDEVFEKPTYGGLRALLDNYEADVGKEEKATQQEMGEIYSFLEEICKTAPMRYVRQYLVQQGKLGPSLKHFKGLLYGLWFDLYGRKGRRDSCGFEHVFCGEEKPGNQVTGFHNWMRFHLEEKAGRVDYRGYIYARRHQQQSETADETPHLITIKFAWEDDDGEVDDGVMPTKSLSSCFIGVSPEFELALYTLCFVAGGEDNHVQVGEYRVNVKCYPMRKYGRTFIGTAYPQALGWEGEE